MNKVIISDFDGTLTKIDTLDFLTSQFDEGQNKESIERKNHEIGEPYLKQRIDKLAGVNVFDIERILGANKEIILKDNYSQFIDYIIHNKIDLIIASGNIEPVVKFFSKLFNASHCFFTRSDISEDGKFIEMKNNGIDKNIKTVSEYLKNKMISWNDVIYIGNDTSDIPFWNSTTNSILFCDHNIKLSKYVTFTINGGFQNLITIIESIIKNNL
jgi:2-hydroxy-3-keto-5-methylthiopentenyl-1-phosphate phosphatase